MLANYICCIIIVSVRAYFKKSLQLQRTEKCHTYKHLKISCQKKLSFSKISDDLFSSHLQKNFDFIHILTTFLLGLVISSISYVSALPNAARTTVQTNFFHHFSQNFTLFSILFYAFRLFQFKIYNYNCTIPILHLQTTFYNCTNCHQLHVKICPGVSGSDKKES